MLSLVNIIAIVGLAATGTLATNVAVTVKICTDQNLQGNCMSPSINTQQQCLGYSKTEWDNNMRSIQIPDHFRCRFWEWVGTFPQILSLVQSLAPCSNNCNGDSTPDLYGPGNSNLPGGMRNKATSFKCYQN
ncbi:hypothetical protein PG996_015252 [Apiospora saccharicola]|uniref:Uncharacterized protein n=1 Tax=Apiospora saccharicola TaxID=335842 RepID=A0ABR1TKL6_9PEZI